ncbi:MAG: response regulator [Betaproteobacteria bacterium]
MPGRVLVVEDNELHLQLVSDLLTLHGFEVLCASTGARALVLAEESAPDLILMDISLQGMNGFEVTRMLKRNPNTAGIPVVALTAYAMQHDQEQAEEAGCAGYIPKPIDTRTFPSLVSTFIPKGGPEGGRTRRLPADRRR